MTADQGTGSDDLWDEFERTPPCDPETAPPTWVAVGIVDVDFKVKADASSAEAKFAELILRVSPRWTHTTDGTTETWTGPSWAGCTDAEVTAVRALERAGWHVPDLGTQWHGPMRLTHPASEEHP